MTTTPPNADDGRTERRPFYTSLRLEPSGDAWKASEPDADSNVYGRGETPLEAVENYAIILQDGEDEWGGATAVLKAIITSRAGRGKAAITVTAVDRATNKQRLSTRRLVGLHE